MKKINLDRRETQAYTFNKHMRVSAHVVIIVIIVIMHYILTKSALNLDNLLYILSKTALYFDKTSSIS